MKRHRPHLRELLLFELAHEGSVTVMRGAARLGGLAAELDRWEGRLSAAGRGILGAP